MVLQEIKDTTKKLNMIICVGADAHIVPYNFYINWGNDKNFNIRTNHRHY